MISAATPDVASAAARLRALLGDRLHEPGDPGYAATTRLWNGAVTRTPALVATCQGSDEVAEAVRIATRCHLPLSVRSGGHDWAGRALRDGALALDLTGLRSVRVDPDAATVTIGGGATAAEVLAAARPYDLVVPTGVVGAVGMAGLTLAGGTARCAAGSVWQWTACSARRWFSPTAAGSPPTPGTTPSCTGRCAAAVGTSASSPSCASARTGCPACWPA